MKSKKFRVPLIFIVSTFVALVLFNPCFNEQGVSAHKTIADDEDEMEGMPAEEGTISGDAIIDDMGEVVEENG